MRRRFLALVVVASALVPAAPAHAGGCRDPNPNEARGATVEMRNRCFQPTVLRVEPGTTVRFVNVDDVEHVISGVGLRDGWPTVAVGQSVEMRFDEAGTFSYMCHLHPGMSGAVVVGGEPTLASTATRPVDDDAGISLLPIALALVVGALGGAMLRRRRAVRAYCQEGDPVP